MSRTGELRLVPSHSPEVNLSDIASLQRSFERSLSSKYEDIQRYYRTKERQSGGSIMQWVGLRRTSESN